ncbi:hypothetical protein [Mycobacterium intracellulare]|uniref:hypothetical protein n=1 Tax=Mycobacterium intracellulare TaxID=1767 RepID=UPI00109EDFB7|nr:hypothetical protein [Mycobacterium intracellulare]
MSAISDLERKLSQLELAGLPDATLSSCAALQIIDAHTLAVVVFDNRNAPLIEQTIAHQNLGVREITIGTHHITIKI